MKPTRDLTFTPAVETGSHLLVVTVKQGSEIVARATRTIIVKR